MQEEGGALNVTGASLANPEGGILRGEITDINLTVTAVNRAVEEAMRTAGQTRLDGIRVSVDGIQFKGENLRDSITIASSDRVITIGDRDREQARSKDGETAIVKLQEESAQLAATRLLRLRAVALPVLRADRRARHPRLGRDDASLALAARHGAIGRDRRVCRSRLASASRSSAISR